MIRSMLFVPGNSPGMLLNAGIFGADALILDLEDAVAPDQKDAARILVRNALDTKYYQGCTIVIRINPADTPYAQDDLKAVVPHTPYAVLTPKVDTPQTVREFAETITQLEAVHGLEQGSVKLIPLLETAQGIENAYAIAGADRRVCAILLGAEDLTGDLRARRSKQGMEIAYSRGRIVTAARAAGIDVYDTPFTDVLDDDGLAAEAKYARQLGFTGKAVISPRHVRPINEAFSPSNEEIEYAREVLAVMEDAARDGRGAVSLRGKMIDKPIVDRARYVLEMARQLDGKNE